MHGAAQAMNAGLRCTRRRQQKTRRRTGWTAIHRRTVGGVPLILTRTFSAFDTHQTASWTDRALIPSDTLAKWKQVFNLVIHCSWHTIVWRLYEFDGDIRAKYDNEPQWVLTNCILRVTAFAVRSRFLPIVICSHRSCMFADGRTILQEPVICIPGDIQSFRYSPLVWQTDRQTADRGQNCAV